MLRAVMNPSLVPKLPKEQYDVPWSRIFMMLLKGFFPLAVLIGVVLGSIIMGIATPSEAAAVGSAGGFILALAYRTLTWAKSV
jgi:TRAP-type mannitol/chloroaromatic compound transport system permease large subunit